MLGTISRFLEILNLKSEKRFSLGVRVNDSLCYIFFSFFLSFFLQRPGISVSHGDLGLLVWKALKRNAKSRWIGPAPGPLRGWRGPGIKISAPAKCSALITLRSCWLCRLSRPTRKDWREERCSQKQCVVEAIESGLCSRSRLLKLRGGFSFKSLGGTSVGSKFLHALPPSWSIV